MSNPSVSARIVLQRQRRRRLEAGHPWVYQTEVERIEGDPTPGDLVDIVNHQGVFLARGYINPRSQIVARVLTYDAGEVIDRAFFTRRIAAAWAHRGRFLPATGACRAVYGEADFLPGLIVDKYGDVLVVQILALGMEVRKDDILAALMEVFRPRGILLRNDVPVRSLEGLPLETTVWAGEVPPEVVIEENGLQFIVDVQAGHKTGYFFDQRDNRAAIRPLMTGWGAEHGRTPQDGDPFWDGAEVLDAFCHTGAFAVHALAYGARRVIAVDISEPALAVGRRNAELNGVADRVQWVAANAFDYLRELERAGRRFDVVILDPPAFAKSRHALEGAIRGYKEINLRGMKLTRDGGYLVTSSCSFHMRPDLFRETILDAAVDAHKVLRLVHWSGAGKDHPEIEGVPEGHYLKFAIYEVRSRR
ncbi:SAM-dependent methyltransferase [Alicyclobacillus cellulosilyticus]|uniref:SAM-dependent methyltransferase n=1 Tax=Alicyclobacillus cellulosilyticus TaxID=1003997 RepID=A0A917KAJ1_9BACL|nr:class I SAM-dependent rRNA methyltransferase [Alicyclobacillus cellulosilyticus]GGJ06885.1 SAM-dependent methyltransferase [Alicyclobacillus cellulosilyticus]